MYKPAWLLKFLPLFIFSTEWTVIQSYKLNPGRKYIFEIQDMEIDDNHFVVWWVGLPSDPWGILVGLQFTTPLLSAALGIRAPVHCYRLVEMTVFWAGKEYISTSITYHQESNFSLTTAWLPEIRVPVWAHLIYHCDWTGGLLVSGLLDNKWVDSWVPLLVLLAHCFPSGFFGCFWKVPWNLAVPKKWKHFPEASTGIVLWLEKGKWLGKLFFRDKFSSALAVTSSCAPRKQMALPSIIMLRFFEKKNPLLFETRLYSFPLPSLPPVLRLFHLSHLSVVVQQTAQNSVASNS